MRRSHANLDPSYHQDLRKNKPFSIKTGHLNRQPDFKKASPTHFVTVFVNLLIFVNQILIRNRFCDRFYLVSTVSLLN